MKNKLQLLFNILLFVSAATVYNESDTLYAQNGKVITIPFKLESNRPVVDVIINKEELKFIFDTGASGAVVTKDAYEILNLEELGKTKVGSPNDPQAINAIRTKIEKMELGGSVFEDISAVVIDFSTIMPDLKIDGIIGPNNFKHYLITFDYFNENILLQPGSLDPDEKGVLKTTFSRIVAFDVFINDKKFEGHIDTGAPSYVTIPYEWKNKFTFTAEPEFVRKGKLASGEVDVYKAKLIGSVIIGEIEIVNPEINLISGGFKTLNLGYEFLKEYKLTIDKKSNLIRLKKIN